MHPLSLKVMTWSWGLFGAVTFVACVVCGLVVPRAFHPSQLLEKILPGFRWLTPGSVLCSESGRPSSMAHTRDSCSR
jgi:hypothetical protein